MRHLIGKVVLGSVVLIFIVGNCFAQGKSENKPTPRLPIPHRELNSTISIALHVMERI
jgi:hypothetical protein